MAFASNPKPSRTARKKAQLQTKQQRDAKEVEEKKKVRRRDRHVCRFPLCGCKKLRLRLEVSHDFHKGMGSKDGVSIAALMVLLCEHRHQHGRISRHAGTLRSVYLTPDQNDGPIAWQIDATFARAIAMNLSQQDRREFEKLMAEDWFEVARERDIQELETLSILQLAVLTQLAEMDL